MPPTGLASTPSQWVMRSRLPGKRLARASWIWLGMLWIMHRAKLANKAKQAIENAAGSFADKMVKLGPLVAGLAAEAWSHIAKFWECMDATELLCTILIGNHCDCSRGKSSVSFNNGLTVKCVMSKTADLSGGFGFSAKPGEMFGGKSKNGKLQLPTGKEIKQEFRDMTKKLKKDARKALKPRTSQAPTGTCETSMDLAFDGLMQAALTIEMSTKGSITTMGISGTVRVSLDGLVKAQGSCSLNAEKWFPEKPKKKVICYKGFCIILLLQGVAELEVNGVLTGTLDLGADVDFDISGSVTVDKTTGHAEAKFETPKIKRQVSFGLGASAFASVRAGVGPFITVFPVPGVPVNFNPMLNLEARAQGDIKFEPPPESVFMIQENESATPSSSLSMLQEAVSSNMSSGRSDMLKMCGAAALNVYIDTGITAFAIPLGFQASLDLKEITKGLTDAMLAGANAAIAVMEHTTKCLGLGFIGSPVASTLRSVASKAAGVLTSIIPSLNLNFGGKPVVLAVPKVFCVEAYKTPGFRSAPCAAQLGCKHVGRLPSSDAQIERVMPEVQTSVAIPTLDAPTCHPLRMGDGFIELGNFRLGQVDPNHFSIAYCSPLDGCNEDSSYYSPVNMNNQGRTVEHDWRDCQVRCLGVVGCAHFSFWPDGGCHLQDGAATRHTTPGATAGPPKCQEEAAVAGQQSVAPSICGEGHPIVPLQTRPGRHAWPRQDLGTRLASLFSQMCKSARMRTFQLLAGQRLPFAARLGKQDT